jgi:hypothetical protein
MEGYVIPSEAIGSRGDLMADEESPHNETMRGNRRRALASVAHTTSFWEFEDPVEGLFRQLLKE